MSNSPPNTTETVAEQAGGDVAAWLARGQSGQPEKRKRIGRDEWSTAEIEILRVDWAAYKDRFEMSANLSAAGFRRSPKACLNKAAELNLPPRDLGVMRKMARGTVVPIAPVQEEPEINRHQHVAKQRPCLCCGQKFQSTWFGERKCLKCKSEQEGIDDGEFSVAIARR